MGCKCQSRDKPQNNEIEVNIESNQNNSIENIQRKLLEQSLLSEINLIRVNPEKYILKMDQYRNKINYDINSRTYYLKPNDKLQIRLKQGNEAIEKCIKSLHKQKKLSPVVYDEALCIRQIETRNHHQLASGIQIGDLTSINYIKDIFKEKLNEITKYEILSFHYDQNAPCGELSAFCQIVDDTGFNLFRRRNILNPKATHIGITCFNNSTGNEIDIVCFYIIMASVLNNNTQ